MQHGPSPSAKRLAPPFFAHSPASRIPKNTPSGTPVSNETYDNPLRAYFERNSGRMISKWMHYFDVYHRHFQRYRGTACTFVEIGVYHGGSLQMWRDYFGPKARIIGIDIEDRSRTLAEPGIEIVIGDQSDRDFLARFRQQVPKIDILLDDGGHEMYQQMVTFEELYTTVAPDGVYLIEDLHTSYWKEYGGGYRHPFTFIEFGKQLIDQMNAWHSRDTHSFAPTGFTESAASMHFYDSVMVIEKQPRKKPIERVTGTPSFPLSEAEKAAYSGKGWQRPI